MQRVRSLGVDGGWRRFHGQVWRHCIGLVDAAVRQGASSVSTRGTPRKGESEMTVQDPTSPRQKLPNETQPAIADGVETILSVTEADIADYTESVVPQAKRRSNFRMLAQFLSMQAVFGTVLVGYGARFQGLTLSDLTVAMLIAAAVMSLYCIGSACGRNGIVYAQ